MVAFGTHLKQILTSEDIRYAKAFFNYFSPTSGLDKIFFHWFASAKNLLYELPTEKLKQENISEWEIPALRFGLSAKDISENYKVLLPFEILNINIADPIQLSVSFGNKALFSYLSKKLPQYDQNFLFEIGLISNQQDFLMDQFPKLLKSYAGNIFKLGEQGINWQSSIDIDIENINALRSRMYDFLINGAGNVNCIKYCFNNLGKLPKSIFSFSLKRDLCLSIIVKEERFSRSLGLGEKMIENLTNLLSGQIEKLEKLRMVDLNYLTDYFYDIDEKKFPKIFNKFKLNLARLLAKSHDVNQLQTIFSDALKFDTPQTPDYFVSNEMLLTVAKVATVTVGLIIAAYTIYFVIKIIRESNHASDATKPFPNKVKPKKPKNKKLANLKKKTTFPTTSGHSTQNSDTLEMQAHLDITSNKLCSSVNKIISDLNYYCILADKKKSALIKRAKAILHQLDDIRTMTVEVKQKSIYDLGSSINQLSLEANFHINNTLENATPTPLAQKNSSFSKQAETQKTKENISSTINRQGPDEEHNIESQSETNSVSSAISSTDPAEQAEEEKKETQDLEEKGSDILTGSSPSEQQLGVSIGFQAYKNLISQQDITGQTQTLRDRLIQLIPNNDAEESNLAIWENVFDLLAEWGKAYQIILNLWRTNHNKETTFLRNYFSHPWKIENIQLLQAAQVHEFFSPISALNSQASAKKLYQDNDTPIIGFLRATYLENSTDYLPGLFRNAESSSDRFISDMIQNAPLRCEVLHRWLSVLQIYEKSPHRENKAVVQTILLVLADCTNAYVKANALNTLTKDMNDWRTVRALPALSEEEMATLRKKLIAFRNDFAHKADKQTDIKTQMDTLVDLMLGKNIELSEGRSLIQTP